MRSVLNSGWTVLVLLITGTYLLGFASTALAEDYTQQGLPVPQSGKVCQVVGTSIENFTPCISYPISTCTDTIDDPNFDIHRPLRYLKRDHVRPYGVCQTHATQGPCAQYAKYPCAKVKMWQTGTQCTNNDNHTIVVIHTIDSCEP